MSGDGAAAGATWSFVQRWMQAQPSVAALVHAVINDRTAAEDLIQETAMALIGAMERYNPERSFTAWALGVARNKVHDHLRKQYRQGDPLVNAQLLDSLLDTAVAMEREPDEQHQWLEALRECMSGVEGRKWDLLRLHYQDEMPPREIAERLALTPGHVSVLLNRLRAGLKRCVEQRMRTVEA